MIVRTSKIRYSLTNNKFIYLILWRVFLCDTIEDTLFKACLYEVSQPGCLNWPLFTGIVRLMLYFFLKLLLCLYVKAGRHAWRDLGSRNRHLGKQASPPSRIKWKQGMSWTSLVKRASRLANRSGSNHLAKYAFFANPVTKSTLLSFFIVSYRKGLFGNNNYFTSITLKI